MHHMLKLLGGNLGSSNCSVLIVKNQFNSSVRLLYKWFEKSVQVCHNYVIP